VKEKKSHNNPEDVHDRKKKKRKKERERELFFNVSCVWEKEKPNLR